MKKLLMIFSLFMFALPISFNDVYADVGSTNGVCANEPAYLTNYYKAIAERSDYQRICKNDEGQWLGVLNIESREVTDFMVAGRDSGDIVYIDFDRDTDSLERIDLKWVNEDYCSGVNLIFCLGSTISGETQEASLYNKSVDGSFLEVLTGDSIRTSDKTEYDYMIIIPVLHQIKTIEIINFAYVLTAEECEALKLDIQEQLLDDLALIKNNVTTTEEEKLVLTQEVEVMYDDLDVVYGEIFDSPCIGDECFIDEEETGGDEAGTPISEVLGKIELLPKLILGGITIGTIGGAVAYMMIKSTITITTDTTKSFFRGMFRFARSSGEFWSEKVIAGTRKSAKMIHESLSNVFGSLTPLIYFAILSVIIILFAI